MSCPLGTCTYYQRRNNILPRARLCFLQPGFFAFKNFFQKHSRKFGSFAILTVLVAKGATTITRLSQVKHEYYEHGEIDSKDPKDYNPG